MLINTYFATAAAAPTFDAIMNDINSNSGFESGNVLHYLCEYYLIDEFTFKSELNCCLSTPYFRLS